MADRAVRFGRVLAVAAGLGAATLAGSAGAQDGSATDRLPVTVSYTGTLTLDRRAHDACQLITPPVLTADVTMTVDTSTGTVTGEFSGTATGEYILPGECSADGQPYGYDATTNYTATITGAVDPSTGAINATAAVARGGSYRYGTFEGMPGYESDLAYGAGVVCDDGTPRPFCTRDLADHEETATITGSLHADATIDLAVDWYTAMCARVTPNEWGGSSVEYGSEGCINLGTIDLVAGDVVWPRNDYPVIDAFVVDPPEPDTNASLTGTVTAHDPDGDALSYTWTVDGEVVGTEPTITFGPLAGGDHVVAVQVTDPAGELDEESALVTVYDAAVADADGDGIGDNDDLCPADAGPAPDGCPEFAASLGCSPAVPIPGEPVACTVTVAGLKDGETLQVDWYLDGGSVQSGPSTAWQWDAATEGDHVVVVDALGEGRSTSASVGLSPIGGEVGAEEAGFRITGLGCNSGISSDEVLACGLTVARDRGDVGALDVAWTVDGATAFVESIGGTSSNWSLERPAPGNHVVAVSVVDPATNLVRSATTPADVRRGRNTTIPPELQALAAGATLLTIGGWLWLESLGRDRDAALAAAEARAADPPPRTDVPSWMYDPRPLAEIWAEEAAEQAQRHGYTGLVWNPELNAFVAPDYQTPEQIEQTQRAARDEWHQLTTTLDNSPGLASLAAFADEMGVHVVLPDGTIDTDALDRVQESISRLGQLELGTQRAPDYTYADAAWDTVSQAADNVAIRIGAGVLLGPAVDPFLQYASMWLRSEQMVRDGMSNDEIMHAMRNEAIMYGGFSIAALAGGQLVQLNSGWIRESADTLLEHGLHHLGDEAALAVTRVGQRVAAHLDHVTRFATTHVDDAWQRGLGGTWRHTGNLANIRHLAATNPTLASAVDDLYHSIDDAGPRALSSADGMMNDIEAQAWEMLRRDPYGYREAVRQGLVPTEVHRTVNWARDRVVRQTIIDTLDEMGPEATRLFRVDITGTGANPLSSRASSAWTDVDLTAMGDENGTFRRLFDRNLERNFGRSGAADALDITCFSDRPGSPAGFTDPDLLRWVETEAHYTGRSIRIGSGGKPIFDYQPDATLAAPRPAAPNAPPGSTTTTWPRVHAEPTITTPPRLSGGTGGYNVGARADVQRLIRSHRAGHPPTSVLDDLRANGKYAQRVWKVEEAGLGRSTPRGIQVLEQIKADRRWVPSSGQLGQAADAYQTYTGLTAGGAS